MIKLVPLLAAMSAEEKAHLPGASGISAYPQSLVVIGSLLAVALVCIALVYVFRKKILRRRKSRHHHHRPEPKIAARKEAPAVTDGHERSGRKRRIRREHRPLNRTLAQTRGLPPLRDAGSPPGT